MRIRGLHKSRTCNRVGGKNRIRAIELNLPTYIGYKCQFCGNLERYTSIAACVFCFYESGLHKDFDKRKHRMLENIKSQARLKKLEFDLLLDDIDWVEICPILNIKLDYFSVGGRKWNTASFDRKDPNRGYVKGNVFIISNRANSLKSDMTVDQIERMYKYVKEN